MRSDGAAGTATGGPASHPGSGRDRLSLRTLLRLPREMAPLVDPRELPCGIVHLGLGAFHRAHQAVCTEHAVAAAGGDWGICGVAQRRGRVRDQLAPQDGLYSVMVRGADGTRLRVIGVEREALLAAEDPAAVVARVADPGIHVVTLTVTEKGYHFDPATGSLRWDHPELVGDLAGEGPYTPIGQLGLGLAARRRAGSGPLSIVCCDNLADNGAVVASLVRQFVERLPDSDGLVDWIEREVRFPSTMVDRIVPATTAADRQAAAERLGVRDEGVVVTEPFSQWVIQERFAGPRPAWERGGAFFTDDVRPFERAKVRLLNGSHSTLAYLAQLAGYELVSDVLAADSPIVGLIERLMSVEVVPTLEPVAGLEFDRYQAELLERFANPALPHRTAQIAMDGSQKLPQRLLGTVADARRAGAEPVAALLGVAAWIRWIVDRTADDGRALKVDDPLSEQIAASVGPGRPAAEAVDYVLAIRTVVAEEFAHDTPVRDILVEHLERLRRDGAEATARHVLRP